MNENSLTGVNLTNAGLTEENLREEIKKNITAFFELKKKQEIFIKNKSPIQYAGAVFDEKEAWAFVSSFLDGWFGTGEKTAFFESSLAHSIGMEYCIVTNSGSSANLLAISALKSKYFDRHLEDGDEVIVPATSFPTTVNPIIQNNLLPVFVDCELGNYNPSIENIREAIGPKTKAIFLAHTLGNPNDMDKIMELAKEHNLLVIEDNCDALGSVYGGKKCGSFGIMSTYSFYPAHHLTMGEGGAVLTSDKQLERILRSLRDWGRACYCPHNGKNPLGACQKRFDFKFPGLPDGYDHKYIYTHIGYNLKPLEFQCAFGLEQLKKLLVFIEQRKKNFTQLYNLFKNYECWFILPQSLPLANPAWFSFPLTIKEEAPFTRKDFIMHLEENKIQTRLLFSGNILKHPAYQKIRCRIARNLTNSDLVTERTFFLGVYPGINDDKLAYMIEVIEKFLSERWKR